MIRRSPIRYKPKVKRTLWRTGRVIEDNKGMARLRSEAYARSGGRCECGLADESRRCTARVTWFDGHLHHIVSRAHGGSDVLSNVCLVTVPCHKELTGVLHWTRPTLEAEAWTRHKYVKK